MLNEIQNNSNVKVLGLVNVINSFEMPTDADANNTSIDSEEYKSVFLNLEVNEDFAKSLSNCIINSKLQVLVFWGLDFKDESEKIFLDAISKNDTIRFLFLRSCNFGSKNIFEVLKTKKELIYLAFSCDKNNREDVSQSLFQLKTLNPKLILNLLRSVDD